MWQVTPRSSVMGLVSWRAIRSFNLIYMLPGTWMGCWLVIDWFLFCQTCWHLQGRCRMRWRRSPMLVAAKMINRRLTRVETRVNNVSFSCVCSLMSGVLWNSDELWSMPVGQFVCVHLILTPSVGNWLCWQNYIGACCTILNSWSMLYRQHCFTVEFSTVPIVFCLSAHFTILILVKVLVTFNT